MKALLKHGQVVVHDPQARVKPAIPHAVAFRYKGVVLYTVPHRLDETTILRNLGYEVPSPIDHDGFKYPGMYKPYAHQRETAAFFTLHKRCACLNDMGLGKTVSAMYAAEYLMQRGLIRRVLVLAPLSTIERAWYDDFMKTIPHRTGAVVHGPRVYRERLLAEKTEWVITNHDGIVTMRDSICSGGFDLIIVDEASMFRNSKTDKYRALDMVLRRNPFTRLWLMTATPASKSPTDVWALAKLVNPSKVPVYFDSFRRMVMDKVSAFKWIPKVDGMKIAYEALTPAIRFDKKDCLDLPPVTYITRQATMTPEQKQAYETMRKHMMLHPTDENGAPITAKNAALRLLKLLQIACGGVYDDDHNFVDLGVENRTQTVIELLGTTNHKALVFVPFKSLMVRVTELLNAAGYSTAMVNGDTSAGMRSKLFGDFQNTQDPRVLVCHPKVAAHGLTLTAADLTIWYAPIYSAEDYTQANNRTDRPGQTKNVTVANISCTPLEDQLYRALNNKLNLQGEFLQLYRTIVSG